MFICRGSQVSALPTDITVEYTILKRIQKSQSPQI